jgi:hypothetical protein
MPAHRSSSPSTTADTIASTATRVRRSILTS